MLPEGAVAPRAAAAVVAVAIVAVVVAISPAAVCLRFSAAACINAHCGCSAAPCSPSTRKPYTFMNSAASATAVATAIESPSYTATSPSYSRGGPRCSC